MILMNLSGAYEPQDFHKNKATIIDCKDISGTKCYLDEAAGTELRRRIAAHSACDIHFLDSGNYHYLSLLWLEKITEPFALVLFDNHPDLQPPSFGEITSCGGWVKEAIETLPNLKRVYMVGVKQELLSALELPSNVILDLDQLKSEPLPLYISFDKDVLSTDFARTDWDQGSMTLDFALDFISSLKSTHAILGMDVCGEDSSWAIASDSAEIISINNETNRILSSLFP